MKEEKIFVNRKKESNEYIVFGDATKISSLSNKIMEEFINNSGGKLFTIFHYSYEQEIKLLLPQYPNTERIKEIQTTCNILKDLANICESYLHVDIEISKENNNNAMNHYQRIYKYFNIIFLLEGRLQVGPVNFIVIFQSKFVENCIATISCLRRNIKCV